MAAVVVLASAEKDRQELGLAVEELGHRALRAADLKSGLELLRTERPKLVLLAMDPADALAHSLLAELEREAPLLPVVVAMTERKAARAMELMKEGVFDVVAPPWTQESLAACLGKALRFRGTALETAGPEEVPRGAAFYALTAGVVLAVALGLAALQRYRREAARAERPVPPTSWELPYSHPGGLAYDGRTLWVSDWFSQTLYLHDPADLRVVRTLHLPREIPGALAFAGDALWVSAAPRGVVKHMLDDRLSVLSWMQDAQAQSVGMAYDGLYLWTCDAATGRIHKRILDDGLSVVSSIDYPGGKPAALAFDLEDPRRVTLRVPLPDYRPGLWRPAGLAFDGKRFWSVAERIPKGQGPARIFVHALPGS
jgi:DNA-binding response OmpR family regulator